MNIPAQNSSPGVGIWNVQYLCVPVCWNQLGIGKTDNLTATPSYDRTLPLFTSIRVLWWLCSVRKLYIHNICCDRYLLLQQHLCQAPRYTAKTISACHLFIYLPWAPNNTAPSARRLRVPLLDLIRTSSVLLNTWSRRHYDSYNLHLIKATCHKMSCHSILVQFSLGFHTFSLSLAT